MTIEQIHKLAANGQTEALLLQLLLEVYQLQQDLIDVRRALGVARPDEQVCNKQEWNGKGDPF